MIYIDPPYNTGKDFIYRDKFVVENEKWSVDSGQKDEDGNKLVAQEDFKQNLASNGRYHSDWLSMMYPRLKLARNLLKDDGVIFISIDDNEVHNLRKMCDEVFGADNFVVLIIWKKRSTPPNDKHIAAQHDYILVYAKSYTNNAINLRPRSEKQKARYSNPDNHQKGSWAPGDLMANIKGGRYVASLYYPIINPRTGQEHYPSSNGNWRFNRDKVNKLIENNEIYFGADDSGRPKLKRFLKDLKKGITWTSLWDFVPLNTDGSKEMTNYLGNFSIFENPKPTGLIIQTLLSGSTSPSDIILDFFSGSATTAHAVMKLNSEDKGNRRFIMVQLPEKCDEKSEAFKAGYSTIAEIGKERIRRAGKKIIEDSDKPLDNLDIGFRVLKIDSSNMAPVYYRPDEITQDSLFETTDNIMPDRTEEDLLFQVLLDWGVDLSLPIEKKLVKDRPVYFVDTNALAACFVSDGSITGEFVRALAEYKPLRVVFRDKGFKGDDSKINVEQIFKQLSPNTDVKCL